jgi:hypothetical protein
MNWFRDRAPFTLPTNRLCDCVSFLTEARYNDEFPTSGLVWSWS